MHVLEEAKGVRGSGTQRFVHQQSPKSIFPFVNFIFSTTTSGSGGGFSCGRQPFQYILGDPHPSNFPVPAYPWVKLPGGYPDASVRIPFVPCTALTGSPGHGHPTVQGGALLLIPPAPPHPPPLERMGG